MKQRHRSFAVPLFFFILFQTLWRFRHGEQIPFLFCGCINPLCLCWVSPVPLLPKVCGNDVNLAVLSQSRYVPRKTAWSYRNIRCKFRLFFLPLHWYIHADNRSFIQQNFSFIRPKWLRLTNSTNGVGIKVCGSIVIIIILSQRFSDRHIAPFTSIYFKAFASIGNMHSDNMVHIDKLAIGVHGRFNFRRPLTFKFSFSFYHTIKWFKTYISQEKV